MTQPKCGQMATLVADVVELAALLHDVGKATRAFLSRLEKGKPERYRHEAVSVMMLAGVFGNGTDHDWLARLADLARKSALSGWKDGLGPVFESALQKEVLRCDALGESAEWLIEQNTRPVAQILEWLILSHHRMPRGAADKNAMKSYIASYRRGEGGCVKSLLGKGAPWQSKAWCERVEACAIRIRATIESGIPDRFTDVCRLYGRPLLQSADHWISSKKTPAREVEKDVPYANTVTLENGRETLAQRLVPHLLGAAQQTKWLRGLLPELRTQLPAVAAKDIPAQIKQPSTDPRFSWQDQAVSAIRQMGPEDQTGWFFGLLVAGTGSGKTIGSLKIASSFQAGLRVLFASPLRSLTLQSGTEFAGLGFATQDVATVIGDPLIKAMYQSASDGNHENAEFDLAVAGGQMRQMYGSAKRLLSLFDESEQRMIATPILAATLDTVMKLADARRGGYLAHLGRVASSDIIIDEIDMYSPVDLIAIGRLIESAGFWKCRVFLCSATLPPAIARSFYQSYIAGARARTALDGTGDGVALNVGWFSNEFDPQIRRMDLTKDAGADFLEHHRVFVAQAAGRAALHKKRRVAAFLPPSLGVGVQARKERAKGLLSAITRLHDMNCVPTPSGRRFSFGCVQVVNVKSCQEIATDLLSLHGGKDDSDIDFRVVCLHGRLSLAVRNRIDETLNKMLSRKGADGDLAPLRNPDVSKWVSDSKASDLVVVLVSTLETTGRDHDFDWGVIESRQERDIIQFAGRIRRHRPGNEISAGWLGNICVWDIPLMQPGAVTELGGNPPANPPKQYQFFGVCDTLSESLVAPKLWRRDGDGLYGWLPQYSEMLNLTYGEAYPAINASRVLADEEPAPGELFKSWALTVRACETVRLNRALVGGGRRAVATLPGRDALVDWLSPSNTTYRLLSNHRDTYRFRAQMVAGILWRTEEGVWKHAETERCAAEKSEDQYMPVDLPINESGLLFLIDEEAEVARIKKVTGMTGLRSQIRLTSIPLRNNTDVIARHAYHAQIGLVLYADFCD